MACTLDSLLVTPSVQRMLWSNYDPQAPFPSSGIIVAGAKDTHWYATVSLKSQQAFDLLLPQDPPSLIYKYLISHRDSVCVIPWFQYNQREYTPEFSQFCDQYVQDPFPGIVVLKPTAAEGKRHFEVKSLSRGKEFPLSTLPPQQVPVLAQTEISRFIQYWIVASRFEERKLRVLK